MRRRAPKPSAAEVALAAVYARVPDVRCRGLCGEAFCGVIAMTPLEYAVLTRDEPRCDELPMLREDGIVYLGDPETLTCPFLDADGRCEQYASRPLVCRLWGATEPMWCPHGCRPAREVSRGESHHLIDQVARISAAWERTRKAP